MGITLPPFLAFCRLLLHFTFIFCSPHVPTFSPSIKAAAFLFGGSFCVTSWGYEQCPGLVLPMGKPFGRGDGSLDKGVVIGKQKLQVSATAGLVSRYGGESPGGWV